MSDPRPESDRNTLSTIEFVVVEKLCHRFVQSLQENQILDLNALIQEVPPQTRSVLIRELFFLELAHKPNCDRETLRQNYIARFPEYADLISHVHQTLNESPTLPYELNAAERLNLSTHSFQSMPGIVGRYRLLGLIGEGGMGAVFRAEDPALERIVAVKIPHWRITGSYHSDVREHFLREARHAARVRHPHICPIHDVGEENGIPFVVMDYIEGRSLADILKVQPRFENYSEVIAIITQLLEALAAVHEHKIIHRDVKPGNVLIDQNGRVFLTDFGLARPDVHTLESGIIGTPLYMAPEQTVQQPDNLDRRVDLYSVGVVLFQMVTGKVPFSGSVLSVIEAIRSKPIPAPSEFRPELPKPLEAIILKATARKPEDRYSTASEFAQALSRVRLSDRITSRKSHRGSRLVLFGILSLVLGLTVGVIQLVQNPQRQTNSLGLHSNPIVEQTDAEREVANWVLSVGGYVQLISETDQNLGVRQAGDALPDEPFYVLNVNLTDHAGFVSSDLDRLKPLKKLGYLSLSGLHVTDEDLLKLQAHTQLHGLYLDRTRVSDKGLTLLQSLPNLIHLTVCDTQVSVQGAAEFRAARPDCKLRTE